MGTKNLIDHLKHCVAAQSMYHRGGSTLSTSSTEVVESEGNTTSVTRMLNSFIKRSGKKVTAIAKIRFVKELLLWLLQHIYLIVLLKTMNLTKLHNHLLN